LGTAGHETDNVKYKCKSVKETGELSYADGFLTIRTSTGR